MQSQRSRWSIAWSAALVLAFAGVSAGQAQPNVHLTVVSSRIVKMQVYIPKGRWVRVAVLEGEPARISDSDLNLSVAFVPVLVGSQVKLHTFRVDTLSTGEERFHWLLDMDTTIGETLTTKVASLTGDNKERGVELLVKVVDVTKAAAPGGPGDLLTPRTASKERE